MASGKEERIIMYFIVNAFLRNNLGDDLFIDHMLKRYNKDIFLFVDKQKYLSFLKSYTNARYTPYLIRFFWRVVRRMFKQTELVCDKKYYNKADAVVRIGGSIFMQYRENDVYFPVKRRKTQPLYVLGANFGPYCTEQYLNDVRNEIKRANDVCFRDKCSFDLFNDLENVRIAPDILWGYPLPVVQEREKSIGISVIDMTDRPGLAAIKDDYIDVMADFCRKMIEQGFSITLYAFCTFQHDDKAIQEICNRSGVAGSLKTVSYDGRIEPFLKDYCSNVFIVGTRFHSVILGWSNNKKVVPVIYSNKLENAINDVGYQGFVWDLLQSQKINSELLIEGMLNAKPLENVDCYKRESVHHFDGLDSFLSE